MNLMIAVGGTKNLGMDIGMQILNMILITITIMSIREDGGSMMKEMTVVITINMLIMLRWKMTITLNEQNLNRVIGTETVIRTMIIIAQRGPILENMITRNLSPILFLISLLLMDSGMERSKAHQKNLLLSYPYVLAVFHV